MTTEFKPALFAIGGILAFFLITQKEDLWKTILAMPDWRKIPFNAFVIMAVVFEPFPLKNYFGSIIQPTEFGILFCLLLAIFIPENDTLKIEDKNILSRLGRLTYGLDLIHTIVINLLSKVFSMANLPLDNALNAIVFVFIAFIISVIGSQISFLIIEKPI